MMSLYRRHRTKRRLRKKWDQYTFWTPSSIYGKKWTQMRASAAGYLLGHMK